MSEPTQTRAFLELMFAGVGDGWLELTYIHPDKTVAKWPTVKWAEFPLNLNTDFERVSRFNMQGFGIYFGCAVRCVSKTKGRGTKADALYITALWCDIDHIDANEGAFKLVSLLRGGIRRPLDPSVIVASGNGVHGYWPLKTPLIVTDQNSSEIERTIRGIALEYGQNADTSVADLARIMRLPGFYNTKPGCGVLCEIMDLYDIRYSFDELYQRYAVNVPMEAPIIRRAIEYARPVDKRMPRWVQAYLSSGTTSNRTMTLFRAACWLFDFGWDFSDVESMLMARAAADGLIADDGEDHVRSHIVNAEREPRRPLNLERHIGSTIAADDHLLNSQGVS